MNNTTLTNIANPTINERAGDMYERLLLDIKQSFNEAVNNGTEPLFVTDATNLYDVLLNNLPIDARQHYNCHTCRHFVNRYGSLVSIDDEGNLKPVMWKYSPHFFGPALETLYKIVKKSKVTGVFITNEKRLGIPKTGVWEHFSVDVPKSMISKDRLRTPFQIEADKLEEFKMLQNAINKYDIDVVEAAVNILRSDSMYRSEKVLGIAEWFLEIVRTVKNGHKRQNIVWKKVATAPAGFCHVSSSMIGTLLDDISEGMSLDAVQRRFNEKMDPLHYQRPQVAPTAGNVARAEKIVAELGIANSLKRRFARLDEIETIWKPVEEEETVTNGIFAGIKTKESAAKKPSDTYTAQTTMTWEKFRRTVLPYAKKIELGIAIGTNSYSAFITAEDQDAPPIIKWDTEEHRNPFTWYMYANGSYATDWNLPSSGYVDVTGISLMPNMWQPGYEHIGEGVFFILKDCKDPNNKSLSLFPELLRSELREVRSTIEAYSKQNKLGGYLDASACGLCLQNNSRAWKCNLRVTTDVGVNLYKLDRWD